MLTACGVARSEGRTETTQATTEVTTEVTGELQEIEQQATDELVRIFSALTDTGLDAAFASLDYTWCDRPQPTYRVNASGRLDQPAGRSSTEDDAITVRELLVELGWTPADTGRWDEGISGSDDRWLLRADRDRLTVSIVMYGDASNVLISVLGPCVKVPADEAGRYDRFVPRDLDKLLGGTAPATDQTEPATTDGPDRDD
jgi:hypothetical protein